MAWKKMAALTAIAAFPAGVLLQRRWKQARIRAGLTIRNSRGIAEERFVRIGGIDQWIGIRGEDVDNPVLLVIHGGPGSSYSIFTPHLRAWEKYFTVVQWDQRGAGRTFSRTGPRKTGEISMERLTRDGIEAAEYLCARLHTDRIFLLASSFGSTFGLEMVRRRPDLFYAYIGADQNVGMLRGRDDDHREIIDRLRALGLEKGVKAIERIGADPTRWSADEFTEVVRWNLRSDPRGYRQTMRLLKNAVWYAPGWRLRDIRAFFLGMRFSLKSVLREFTAFDAWKASTRFEIPLFIFQGENDVLTPVGAARAYFDEVTAPIKQMALISDAGHFAAFLNPEEFLRQLLTHVRPLAYSRPAA